MSLMMSSCCTFRLNRRRALSIDSPSWILTSATRITPPQTRLIHGANMLRYHGAAAAHVKHRTRASGRPVARRSSRTNALYLDVSAFGLQYARILGAIHVKVNEIVPPA